MWRRHDHRDRMPGVLRDPGGRPPFRQGVLPPGPGQDGEAEGREQLFPPVTMEDWREGIFQVCWQQHGGSGLAVTLGDVLELPTTDRDWLVERIGQQRAREAKELEKAAKRRRRVALNNLGLGLVFTARDLASGAT